MHPAAKILVDIARAQDAEVGDGTTSVVLLAGEILKEIRPLIEDGVGVWIIEKGLRTGASLVRCSFTRLSFALLQAHLALSTSGDQEDQGARCSYRQVQPRVRRSRLKGPRADLKLKPLSLRSSPFYRKFREHLLLLAGTSMSSKLIYSQKPFFSAMVVDAVLCLDQEDLDENLIGTKKVPGGGMQVRSSAVQSQRLGLARC